MKKILLRIKSVIIIVLAAIFCVSCGKKIGKREDIIEYLKELKSYTSSIEIYVKNDRETLEYSGKQYYSQGMGYRLEIGEDRVYIYKDQKIYIKDSNNGQEYITSKDFDNVYRLSFIEEYVHLLYTDENIKHITKKIGDINYEVVSLELPGNNRSLKNAEMYIEAESRIPDKLVIYDNSGREKFVVKYKNFKANLEINKDLFKV